MKIKGGEKFEKAMRELAKKLDRPGTVKVGFLEGATYPDENQTPVAMVAAIQNFGAPKVGIPPRPFFTNMVKDKSPTWPKVLGNTLKATGNDVPKTLGIMGQIVLGELQQAIIDTSDPPLSPVTIMLRGMRSNNPNLKVNRTTVEEARARVEGGKTNYGASSKVFIDSGHMLKSADYEVNTK